MIVNFHLLNDALHHFVDAAFCFIQSFDEKIADFGHEIRKAEEAIGLSVHCEKK